MNIDYAPFREKLTEQQKHLEQELSRIANPTKKPGDYATRFPEDLGSDIDENAAEVEEYTDNLALENTLEQQLNDVRAALTRMEEGAYGTCERCGTALTPERLNAYPAARTCVECGK